MLCSCPEALQDRRHGSIPGRGEPWARSPRQPARATLQRFAGRAGRREHRSRWPSRRGSERRPRSVPRDPLHAPPPSAIASKSRELCPPHGSRSSLPAPWRRQHRRSLPQSAAGPRTYPLGSSCGRRGSLSRGCCSSNPKILAAPSPLCQCRMRQRLLEMYGFGSPRPPRINETVRRRERAGQAQVSRRRPSRAFARRTGTPWGLRWPASTGCPEIPAPPTTSGNKPADND